MSDYKITKTKCQVVSVMDRVFIHYGDTKVEMSYQQARELSDLLANAADSCEDWFGCNGAKCVKIPHWCPECDREQNHIRISQYAIECCECGEITEHPENY